MATASYLFGEAAADNQRNAASFQLSEDSSALLGRVFEREEYTCGGLGANPDTLLV